MDIVRKRPAFKKIFPVKLEPIVFHQKKKSQVSLTSSQNVIVDPEPPLYQTPQITLYHINRSRSTRVLWLINEIGGEVKANTKLAPIDWDFLKTKEYFAVNPNQLVPAVTINGHHMFEAGAIVRFICEKMAPHYETTKKLFPATWTEENWARHYLYSYWCIIHLDKEIISNFFWLKQNYRKDNRKGRKMVEKNSYP